MNFEKQKEISFQDILREKFLNQPKTFQAAEQIFNLVDGGIEAVDNAKLNDEEKEKILKIIKDSVNSEEIDFKKVQMISSYQDAVKMINEIIENAFDRIS
jgi:translation initiation factor 2 alpha subunit (eIF-2alpha)